MKRLIILALIALAAWYGWNHRGTLLASQDRSEAGIENSASYPIERVRLTVDRHTMVKESIAPREQVVIPFAFQNDSDFNLVWRRPDKQGERHWRGGGVSKGSFPQRYVFQIDNNGRVAFHTEPKATVPA